MDTTFAIILATFLVITATLIPTFVISKKQKTSEEDWAVASRSLPLYVVIGTQFASATGGGILVGHLGNAYTNGISIAIYGLMASLPFFIIMYPAKWLRKNNFSTVPEILKSFSNNSKLVTVVAAIMTIVVPFGWVTSQITAFGSIYSVLTGFNYNMLCIIFCIVSLLFVMPSGLKTVAWTDFIFSCFIIVMCIVSVFFVTNLGGGPANLQSTLDPYMLEMGKSIKHVGEMSVVLWIFSVLPGGITNQLYFQRICAIDNEKHVNVSLIASGLLSVIVYIWAIYMGMSIKAANPLIDGSSATGWFMSQLPLPLLAGFAALIFATMMSTLSSGVQSVVVNITRDILPIFKPDLGSQKKLKISRILSLVIIISAALSCLVFTSTIKWITSTYAFSAATLLCPIYIGYAYRNKKFVTRESILASMVAGALGCIVGIIFQTRINYAAIGVVFSFVTIMIVSYITSKKDTGNVDVAKK